MHADGYYSYDAAGKNNYMELPGESLPIGEMTFDGDDRSRPSIAQLAEWYVAADVLAVPSWYEPFGIVILEGMLYGLPIVAADSLEYLYV